jgi:uncharacterized protein (TIGR03437 family)
MKYPSLLLVWAFLTAPAFASPLVFYDATGDAIDTFDGIAQFGPLAFSFTTGATASTLADVKLSLHGTGSGTGSVTVSLYSNNPTGPQPGSSLATLGTVTDGSVPAGNSLQDLPVTPSVPLAANARYWIVLSTNNLSQLGFNWSESDAGIGVAAEFNIYDGQTYPNSTGPFIGYVAANPPPPVPPVPSVSGVVSASAFGDFPNVAPGSWIEIYGSNLAPDSRSWTGSDFSGNNAPTMLDGVSVTIGGQSAFVDYISAGQVNAQVPSNVSIGGMVPLVVTNGNTASQPVNVAVQATEPGLLAPSSFKIGGNQYVVALLPDGSYVLPTGAIPGVSSRPAHPGDEIVMYGVGFGAVTPEIDAGVVVTQSNQLALPLQISFAQTPAQSIAYGGLAPNYVGLYQFNVVVPAVPASDLVPLTFNLGGVAGAQTLFTAVEQP